MKNKKRHDKDEMKNGMDYSDEIKRLNRVTGQIEGVCKMLKDQRRLDDVLMQCKAIHSALKAVESRIIKAHLDAVLDGIVKMEKKKTREQKIAELEELFKHAS